jgi:hypothetical protein
VFSIPAGDFDNDESHGPEADVVVDDHAELLTILDV